MRQILFSLFFILLKTGLYSTPSASIIIHTSDTVCPNGQGVFNLTGTSFTDSLVVDWGDGSPTELHITNPNFRSHIFSATSTVTLIAYEGVLTDTATVVLVVLQLPQPKFGFSYNSLVCYKKAGVQVSFTDSSAGGNPPYSYKWLLGDGTSDTAKNPIHTYLAPGKYIIKLSVTLKHMPQHVFCLAETYKDSLEIFADTTIISGMNALAGCPCNNISFTGNGNATSWLWDFGDGDTSSLQNITHRYREPGQYIVTLNGIGNTGCYFFKKMSITVCGGDTLLVSKSNNTWYFGGYNTNLTLDPGGIDFNPASPVALTNGNMNAHEGCATISDADNGSLLFYTNGVKVWDNTHAVMPNGTGLFGGISTAQSSLIIPFPGNRNLYYIITGNGVTDFYKGYYYSIVDMRLNGGKGDVTTKNNVLFVGPCPELNGGGRLVAHEALSGTTKYKGDCLRSAEYWVVIPACKDTFKVFLINSSGINSPITIVVPDDNYNGSSYSCFSPDGKKYAISQSYGQVTSKIRLFDFDKNTGNLSNERRLTFDRGLTFEGFYGISFSPNSSLLYAPLLDKLYQWNTNVMDIQGSMYRVTFPGGDMMGNYLGPDGKIYIACSFNQVSLSVINNPDIPGGGCNLSLHSFFLAGRKAKFGLQNIVPLAPNDTVALHSSFTSTVVPCTFQVNFSDSSCRFIPDSITTTWDYGDGNIASYNTIQFPSHTYINPGTYNVKLVLTKNCYKSDSVTKQIVINPLLSFTTSTVPSNCNLANGSATANPIGGNPSYTYNWSNGATRQSASNLSVNSYTVIVTDSNGCSQNTIVVIDSVPQPASTIISAFDPLCNGDATGVATMSVSAGVAPFTYQWSGNGGTNLSASGLTAGTYSFTLTDSVGCQITRTVTINQPSLVVLNPASTPDNCDSTNGTASANASGGTGVLQYNWSTSETQSSITGLSAGTYSVTATDDNGCTKTATVVVIQNSGPTANAGNSINIFQGANAMLSGSGGGNYLWSPAYGLSCISCQSPVASPTKTTMYYLVVTDANGCTDMDSVIVTVENGCMDELFIPNAFSPNEDGQNELFKVISRNCIKAMKLIVYDRWGEIVFETNNINEGWDGKFKGELLDTDVFAYTLVAELLNNSHVTKKGNVSLIR